MPKVSTTPLWIDRFPASRSKKLASLKGEFQTDVVVVGGGLTGCTVACVFAGAGVRTILIEAESLGSGATGRSSGLLRPDAAASFRDTQERYGLRTARTLWQATRRAALDSAAAFKRLGIRCDPTTQDALTIARGSRDREKTLRREFDAEKAAGLDVAWLNGRALAHEAAVDHAVAGIKTRDGVQIDPYRAVLGMAAAARQRGAELFERSPAVRIRASRKFVDVRTAAGAIRASAVVIATGYPPADLRGLRRHFTAEHSYAVVTEPMPAAMRRAAGRRASSLEDAEVPPHTLRWMRDDSILLVGAAQREVPPRSRDKVLEQRMWQLMYELSLLYPVVSGIQPTHAWDIPVSRTVDGLPYLGLHRNYPRHLFALGIEPHRLGYSWLAARILLRRFQGASDKDDEAFGFARIL